MIRMSFAISLSCGLGYLLSSCEKELIGEGSGRKVAVSVSLSSSDYVDATRSSAAPLSEEKSSLISLGDGLYARTTLTEEPADELRATVSLVEGQKVCLAAFKGATNTQEGSTANYIYSGGKLLPADPFAPLFVTENANYTIVAYSYYNNPSVYPVIANIDSSNQLLWGKSAQKYITMTDATVSITMAQQFAMVKIVITSTNLPGAPNITAVSGVTIDSGTQCSLSVWNGTMNTGTPATQSFTFSTVGSSVVTSTPRTIYTTTTPVVRVVIGSISLAGRVEPVQAFTAHFLAASDMLAGHSYVFTVDLKNIHYAGSNVYWDSSNSKLTFEPYGYTGEKSFYQGLYFKWGSLVGVSPKNRLFGSSTPIYYPTDDNNCTATSGSVSAIQAMDIPAGTGGLATDYVTTFNLGNPSYSFKLGDICQWIDGNYRLPRAEEVFSGETRVINWSATSAIGWKKGTNSGGAAITFPAAAVHQDDVLEEDGTSVLDYDTYAHFGAGFATAQGGVVLPASGMASQSGRGAVGTIGEYWSSSYSSSTVTMFGFDDTEFYLRNDALTFLHTIRCVKK
jgi:hypothetical protein